MIRHKQPYIDWANSFDDGGPTYDPERDRATVFLIDAMMDTSDLKKVLRRYWRDIFEEQLNSWMCDPDVWPQAHAFDILFETSHVFTCK